MTAGDSADITKIYYDSNGNGVVDDDENTPLTIAPATSEGSLPTGSADAGYDLSNVGVYGSTKVTLDAVDPLSSFYLTMTGGKVNAIAGSYNVDITDDVDIHISGGIIGAKVAAEDGGDHTIGGNVNISISGNTAIKGGNIFGTPYGGAIFGGPTDGGTVKGNISIAVSDNAVVGDGSNMSPQGIWFVQGGVLNCMGDVTLHIKGGTVNGGVNPDNMALDAGKKFVVNMTGGTVNGPLYGAYKTRSVVKLHSSEINILGGTVNGNVTGCGASTNSQIDGAPLTKINISGGTFNNVVRLRQKANIGLSGNDNISIAGNPAFGESGYIFLRDGEKSSVAGELTGTEGGIKVKPETKALGTEIAVPASVEMKQYLNCSKFTGLELAADTIFRPSGSKDRIVIGEKYKLTYDLDYDEGITPGSVIPEVGSQVTLANAVARDGYAFMGWKYKGTVYDAGSSFTMSADDVTMVAVWKESGDIDVDITDGNNSPLAGVVIKITQGTKIISTGTTDSKGEYLFKNLPYGVYNLEATYTNKDNKPIVTSRSIIVSSKENSGPIKFDEVRLNTQVTGDAPLAADNLINAIPQSEKEDLTTSTDESSTVAIAIELKAETKLSDVNIVAAIDLTKFFLTDFIDMTVEKIITTITNGRELQGAPTQITETAQMLTIYTPVSEALKAQMKEAQVGSDRIRVWREHGGQVNMLSKGNAFSTWECYYLQTVKGEEYVVLKVNKFSSYALGIDKSQYTPPIVETKHTIKASASVGGTITPSGDIEVRRGSNAKFKIEPKTGYAISYVIADGKKVGAVGTYTFENVTGDHQIKAVFKKKAVKPNMSKYKIISWSKLTANRHVYLQWRPKKGTTLQGIQGYEIFRSKKMDSGYGTKPIGTATKKNYTNTKNLKKGTRYFYKVRGYIKFEGKKYYTGWSSRAWRMIR